MKTFLYVLFLLIVVSMAGWLYLQNQPKTYPYEGPPRMDNAYYKVDYVAKIKPGVYQISKDPVIEIHVLTASGWKQAMKKYHPKMDPDGVQAFVLQWPNGLARIYIPEYGSIDGGIDEHSLGHEFVHLIDWYWHQGQDPNEARARCQDGRE